MSDENSLPVAVTYVDETGKPRMVFPLLIEFDEIVQVVDILSLSNSPDIETSLKDVLLRLALPTERANRSMRGLGIVGD